MAKRRKPTGSPGYIPGKIRKELVEKAADRQLDRFIKENQDLKNQDAGIVSIVTDMPEKFAKGFVNSEGEIGNPNPGEKSKYYRADGSLNAAGLSILGHYSDDRPEYSRQMNRLVNSSPQLKAAYARRAPFSNFMMNVLPRFIPVVGPAFTADQVMKNKKLEQNYLNRPESDYNKYVEYFKPQMNTEQVANTEIIKGEKEPLVSPADMNLQEAKGFVSPADMNLQGATPFRSPQDMGFLDDENIFDSEKAAIDAALAPGNVFDPVAADKQSKVDFINQVENTNMTVEDAERSFGSYGKTIDDMFERAKQKQGMVIRDEVQIEEPEEAPVIGQFDFTDQGTGFNLTGAPDQTTEGLREQIDMNTADPNLDIFTNQAFMGAGPSFPAGGVSSNKQVDPGLDMVGNKAFPSEGGSQEALDILNSNADPYFSGQPTMGFGFADGGSTNKYENMSTHEKLMRMAAEMYG